jgi:hypothetical protein
MSALPAQQPRDLNEIPQVSFSLCHIAYRSAVSGMTERDEKV